MEQVACIRRRATSNSPMSPDLSEPAPGPLAKRSGKMRLCLVEDLAVAGVEPLTLTRPMHELLLGCSTLGCKIASAFGVGPGPQRRGSVVRSHLVAVQRQRDPHMVANDRDWLARGPVIVVNARWVPPSGFEPPDSHGPWVGLCDGQPPAPWSVPKMPCPSIRTESIPGSTRSLPGTQVSTWAANGSSAPGIWWPATERISSAIFRRPGAAA